ncbi:MAG: hypothetical protein ACOX3T_02995 [Bdellovibrionota bacterium]
MKLTSFTLALAIMLATTLPSCFITGCSEEKQEANIANTKDICDIAHITNAVLEKGSWVKDGTKPRTLTSYSGDLALIQDGEQDLFGEFDASFDINDKTYNTRSFLWVNKNSEPLTKGLAKLENIIKDGKDKVKSDDENLHLHPSVIFEYPLQYQAKTSYVKGFNGLTLISYHGILKIGDVGKFANDPTYLIGLDRREKNDIENRLVYIIRIH